MNWERIVEALRRKDTRGQCGTEQDEAELTRLTE